MIMETVQTLDLLGHWGEMRDNSAEVLSQCFFPTGGHCEEFRHEPLGMSIF